MKKYFVGVLCSLIILMPSLVLAKKITCSNDNFSATIEIDKEEFSAKEKAFIAVTSDFEYKSVSYKADSENIVSVSEEGIITPLSDGEANITAIVNFKEDDSCQVDFPIKVLSSDASLKNLNIEEFDMSEMFKTDKFDYDIVLPYKNDKINIIAETNNIGATITGDGRKYLNEGLNIYNVMITASDGTKSTYRLNITRKSANDDATLSSLSVDGYKLDQKFSKDNYKYEIKVDKDVEEINIKATATYDFTKVFGAGKKKLATGLNIFYVRVISENGNESKYEISVTKSSGDSYLESLVVSNAKLDKDFAKDIYIYNTTVNNEITKLDIQAKSLDDVKVEIMGNEDFKEGENEVIIRVTGKDGTSVTYKILVNRLSKIEEKELKKNNILLIILFCMFIVAIIFMIVCITIFIKKNYKKKYKLKTKIKGKKDKKKNSKK